MIRLVVALLAAVALMGCALLPHGDSPQQQFMTALQRGNSMQASQIWLNMSADDRANMSHSQGFKPATSPEEIKAKLMAQQQATGDSDLGGIETGDIDSQRIELPAVDSSGSGGLQNLPNLPSTFATGSTSVDDPR